MGMGECARFIADNGIKLDRIFSHRWKLDQADEAYKVLTPSPQARGLCEF